MTQRRLAIVGLLVAGCTRFEDVPADAAPPSVSSDANSDAATAPDASQGSFDGRFEGAAPSCGPDWAPASAAVTLSRGAGRTDTGSCRLCESSGSTATAGLDIAIHLVARRPVSGQKTAIGSAWLRLASPAVGGAIGNLQVWLYDRSGRYLGVAGTGDRALTKDWLEISFQAPVEGDELDVVIAAQGGAKFCVEVDDVTLSILPR